MKKIYTFILPILILFTVTSCDDVLVALLEDDTETTEETADEETGDTSETEDVSEIRTNIIELARDQIGTYYSYGGASPETGFDCSGLVYYCYGEQGISLPRSSYDQYSSASSYGGDRGSIDEARLADVISFDPDNDGRVSHSGMFIDSETFIHSPRTGRTVCEDSLIGYWEECLVGITDYIGE